MILQIWQEPNITFPFVQCFVTISERYETISIFKGWHVCQDVHYGYAIPVSYEGDFLRLQHHVLSIFSYFVFNVVLFLFMKQKIASCTWIMFFRDH